MTGGNRTRGGALGNDLARASFALTTLSGHAKFELHFVKAHAGTRVTRDFAIRDSAAHTNDHGETAKRWLEW